MWKLLLVLVLPLAPLAAAYVGAPGSLARAAGTADVQCLIRTEPFSGGIQLEGVVTSKAPLSGTYHFDVRKTGRAGSSSSLQSGDFDVPPGEEVIGQVGLGLERGASYDAKLMLRWVGGEASCEASGPDRA